MTSQTITALGNAIINLINRKTPVATASTVGMVKPDGNTINIDANGVISSNGGGGSGFENKITNCLLEVPQKIKLELNDGTLTLKAGSQVIVPNGFEADRTTPKFDEITITNDTIIGGSIQAEHQNLIAFAYIRLDGDTQNNWQQVRNSTSGSSHTPSTWHVWYDTNSNLVKLYETDAQNYASLASLPFAVFTITDGNLGVHSIDQVFNGMGYIGSTIWIDKGVKGLIPNGRNEDGSLKNIEYTKTAITIFTVSSDANGEYVIRRGDTDYFDLQKQTLFYYQTSKPSSWGWWYNPDTNFWYQMDLYPDTYPQFTVGNVSISNGVITSFNPKLPFRAVDYNEFNDVRNGGSSSLEICDIGMALYVDETKGLRRYLNGQIVDIKNNTQAFLNRLKDITTLHPSLLCTENEWQTAKTMSAFGQVGRFVFNYSSDEIVSVRLPRVVNVQGLFDLQNLGMTVAESLPNITGHIQNVGVQYDNLSYSGVFKNSLDLGRPTNWAMYDPNVNWAKLVNVRFNANNSNGTYQDNAPVQQEAIQYPYFIQIATGSETENNIINEIELNNPFSLFDSKYSDHELNNLSWLKSEGQWNAKATYPTAYDKLLKVYNGTETVEGLSVKLSTEEYTDYDFVLNTAEETFRLPLLDGSETLPTGEIINQPIPSTGNSFYDIGYNCFVTIRLEGCTHCRLWDNTQVRETWTQTGADLGFQGKTLFMPKGHQLGLYYENGTMTKFTYQKAKGNGSLYYYVGETVQNANLIDAGRIGEQLANKVDLDAQNLSIVGKSLISSLGMPSTKFIDLTVGASGSAYTAPANGWYCFDSHVTGYYIFLNSPSMRIVSVRGANADLDMSGYIPVQKGQIVQLGYDGTWSPHSWQPHPFRFVYAEGSK